MNPTFEIFPNRVGKYHWRLRSQNGQIQAISGEWYANKSNATRAVWNLRLLHLYKCTIKYTKR